jgi:octaprenyl-diphosphate synthase
MPVSPSDLRVHAQQQRTEFSLELDQVQQTVLAALDGLQAPFNQFVISQLRQVLPLRRAAVVLTGGLAAVDNEELRGQRIDLAAAQEVLYLALHIHMRLVGQVAALDDQSRSILGSTILAGDFCFSRSAELAVHTGNPKVVEIFAETLKRVSEGHLRLLFTPDSTPFDETSALFDAGMHAAGILAGLTPPVLAAARAQVRLLAGDLNASSSTTELDKTLTDSLNAPQLGRWLALSDWSRAQAA